MQGDSDVTYIIPSISTWLPISSLTTSLTMLPTTIIWSHGCPHPPPETKISLCGPINCQSGPVTPNTTYITDLSPCTKYKVNFSNGGQNGNSFYGIASVKTPSHIQVKKSQL